MILSIVLFVPLTSSCSKLERDEVVTIAAELIEKSYEINEIFYGEGLPLNEWDLERVKANYENGVYSSVGIPPYVTVSDECEYTCIDDIKEAARAVYTESYCSGMFEAAFEGIRGGGGVFYYARYIENDLGYLAMKYDAAGSAYELSRTYDMESLLIDKQTSSYVTFTVDSYVDGVLSDPVQLKITSTPSGWRLDTPTY